MLSDGRFRFNSHPRLEGSHAFLSPSKYHWLRWPEDKLVESLLTSEAAALGTRLHAWAAEAILLKREQPRDGDILCAYVNDALDLELVPEQTLFYSLNCYGQADAIGFEEEDHFLRIHDLKTGVTKASVDQLYVYAGLFCLEYEYSPFDIDGELRIYQGDDADIYEIDRVYLAQVYDKIRTSNDIIERRGRRG